MRFFLLFFLLFTACERCPRRAPPYTWRPLVCNDPFLCKGKIRKRPLYKARVPNQWKALPDREHTTFEIKEGVEIVFRQLLKEEAKEFSLPFNHYFYGNVDHEKTQTVWTLIPNPKIRQTLLKPGQTAEEEYFFSLLAAPFQIEFSASEEEKKLYLSDVENFIDSLTFIQGLPN